MSQVFTVEHLEQEAAGTVVQGNLGKELLAACSFFPHLWCGLVCTVVFTPEWHNL